MASQEFSIKHPPAQARVLNAERGERYLGM